MEEDWFTWHDLSIFFLCLHGAAQVLEKMDNHWACREKIVLVAVKWGQQMEFIGADTMIMKWSERILSYNECG